MRTLTAIPLLLAAGALAVGCGQSHRRPMFDEGAGLRPDAVAGAGAVSRDDAARRSSVALDDIEPKPVLPSTRPAGERPPSLDALQLYARGRSALIDNQRFTGIKLLEEATRADPVSAAPYRLLARAYLGNGTFNDKAIDALDTATGLEPADVTTRVELGRQYLAKGDVARALVHLRLALATPGYAAHEDDAALADLFLAKALVRGGYDRAALDAYERLLGRLRSRTLALRRDPELSPLVAKPDLIALEIGQLHEKYGRHELALAALEGPAANDASNFELRARVVRLRAAVGQRRRATDDAAALVSRFRASPASVDLLREVTRNAPPGEDAVAEMRKLSAARPGDRMLLFAWSDLLRAEGRGDEATRILVDALGAESAGVEVTRRLFDVYDARGDARAAARLLVETLARQPDAARELSPLWADLTRPSRRGRLRVEDVESMAFPPSARAAQAYATALVAELWRRPAVARAALDRATAVNPPYAPAYRALATATWKDVASDDRAKAAASDALIARAAAAGDEALADEVRALALLEQRRFADAALAAGSAEALTPTSADRTLLAAAAAGRAGDRAGLERRLWKLLSDRPTYEDAYEALFAHYLGAGDSTAAVKVLTTWLAADPASVPARMLQANVYRQAGQPDAAERLLLSLVDERPADAEVLAELYVHYAALGRLDDYVARLEDLRAKRPDNGVAAEMLVDAYAEQDRYADAARVLDASRAGAAGDADLLYHFASLYTRARQQPTAEQLLQQVVELDPAHAPASNDLGYAWADAGRHLDRAEALVRVAVDAEPGNASFLDSLGWVLYKRGQYAEAADWLRRAAGPSPAAADPIVLDHLGDALYRMKQPDAARDAWRQSLDGIDANDAPRDDLKELRLKLLQKLKQADAGQAVNVAPVPAGTQARSGE